MIPLVLLALVTAPAGWVEDKAVEQGTLQVETKAKHFGGLPAAIDVQVYFPAADESALAEGRGVAGIQLMVHRIAANVAPAQLAGAVRAELDAFHRPGLAVDAWNETADPAKRQVEATFAWHEGDTLVEHQRLVIATDGKQVVAVLGECMESNRATSAQKRDCEAALATIDPGVEQREPIELPPQVTTAPTAPVPTELPGMTDGTRVALPPMTIPHEPPPPDRRPVYVGAGIVVLAAIFWWNRRRRERFEREDEHDD